MPPRINLSRPAALALSCCLALLLPSSALAWGAEGHSVVARVAAARLKADANSKNLEKQIGDILQASPDFKAKCKNKQDLADKLACISSWADDVRDARPKTSQWHFVDIPLGKKTYDRKRDCDPQKGSCVIDQVSRLVGVLADKKESPLARAEALMFIVHFVGDMHQPLHGANDPADDDSGGNLKFVRWFKDKSPACDNLHKVWDGQIVGKTDASDVSYAAAINAALDKMTAPQLASMAKGGLVPWAEESHALAEADAYGLLPAQDQSDELCRKKVNGRWQCFEWGTPNCKSQTGLFRYPLGQDYYDANRGVVELQLERGGVRLARVLKEALEKAAPNH